MAARRAFVLGAIVGAGVLAAFGAVSAGSSGSATPQARADTVPAGLFADLKHIDKLLSKLIADEKGKALDANDFQRRVHEIEKAKGDMVAAFFDQQVYGTSFKDVFGKLDCVDVALERGLGYVRDGGPLRQYVNDRLTDAKKCKEKLETEFKRASQPAPPQKVSITESDTWAHNPEIGKSNICINVKTTPPQASISAGITGPGTYKANLPKTPLHPDGTRPVGATITQAGAYADVLTVYDKSGKQTATTTKTFTVSPPPQDGPTPKFGPACPEPAQ